LGAPLYARVRKLLPSTLLNTGALVPIFSWVNRLISKGICFIFAGMKPVTRRKASQVDPEKERMRNELMDAYMAFVQDAGYDGYPVEKVEGWPKRDNWWMQTVDLDDRIASDPDFKNAVDLTHDYARSYSPATGYNLQYVPSRDAMQSSLLDTEEFDYQYGRTPKEVAFIDLPDFGFKDDFISIPRPRFRLGSMNPFELVGMEQEIPDRQLQTGGRQQMDRIKAEPIMRADASVRGGQYQVGERVWDPEKKRWQDRMWDREDKKASREMQGELKEKWRRGPRDIETPPGGFKYGGKIKVKKKNC
jgi:hypothetical protein